MQVTINSAIKLSVRRCQWSATSAPSTVGHVLLNLQHSLPIGPSDVVDLGGTLKDNVSFDLVMIVTK